MNVLALPGRALGAGARRSSACGGSRRARFLRARRTARCSPARGSSSRPGRRSTRRSGSRPRNGRAAFGGWPPLRPAIARSCIRRGNDGHSRARCRGRVGGGQPLVGHAQPPHRHRGHDAGRPGVEHGRDAAAGTRVRGSARRRRVVARPRRGGRGPPRAGRLRVLHRGDPARLPGGRRAPGRARGRHRGAGGDRRRRAGRRHGRRGNRPGRGRDVALVRGARRAARERRGLGDPRRWGLRPDVRHVRPDRSARTVHRGDDRQVLRARRPRSDRAPARSP